MIKNAILSLRKNIGKTILLFVIMIVIANLIIAGLSIQSATKKSMDSIRSSLGNDVTLTTNFKNMMANRQQGQAINDVASSITIDMANQLVDLDYVESYNYTISSNVDSDTITAVELDSSEENSMGGMNRPEDSQEESGDFTISANTTMANLDDFTSSNSELIEGRLLDNDDSGTNNCVVETNLAQENDLSVGSTITVYTTVNEETVTQELTIVGIYEISSNIQVGRMGQSNPVNTIYTDFTVGQVISGSTTDITSATYYLDDPQNADAFIELAKESSDIDFDTYTLDANDQLYQQNVSSLENTQSFSTMFLWVVIIAGSVILCLILVLTIRSRYYEIGVFLSLGQSKLKIIGQQLIEIGVIAVIAFVLSLGTGKMVSNVISGMLVSTASNESVQMEIPESSDDSSSQQSNHREGMSFDNAFNAPTDVELDVSLTSTTVIELAGITAAICVVSIILPSTYILRLSPREILARKEG